ncbi:MAG: hypothetical protein O3C11_08275 [Proteobacteria bacterium]|nr:hypothetical protein [Pseudomonadota bacterium]
MIYDLPDEVRKGLEFARKRDMGRKNRLRVHVGENVHSILRLWDQGFALDAQTAPLIRGFVDIYDSGKQLYQCLVMCSSVEGGERIYEFKRQTAVVTEAPVDFWRDQNTPVGLLT